MRVALYARVSTEEQNNANQMDRLVEFACSREYEIAGLYEDKASGKNKSRPELDRMVDDAKHKRFDRILATKIDRLGRSVIHLTELFEQMESYGVDIEMTDQSIDTSTSAGRFTRNILSAVAELERELISERTKAGLTRTAAAGKKLGRSRKKLTVYQKEKMRSILEKNPKISQRDLAKQFEGISRNTLIRLAQEEGLLHGR